MRAVWFIGKFELTLKSEQTEKLFTQIPHTAIAANRYSQFYERHT